MQASTREKYETIFMNIISTAETIADLRKRDPSCVDVITALTLKMQHVKKNTSGALISGFRNVMQSIVDNLDAAPGGAVEGMGLPDWFTQSSRHDLEAVLLFSKRTPQKINAECGGIVTRFCNDAMAAGYQGSQEELISSFSVRGVAAPSAKSERPFSFQEMMTIDMALSAEEPEAAINSTYQSQVPHNRGLARVFALSIWATGMRPVELWNCRLMVPIPERVDSQKKRDMAIESPRQALLDRLYMNVESVTRSPGETLGDVAMAMTKSAGAPAILIIKSAKQSNANKMIKSEFRLQVLQDAPRIVLSMLSIVAQLRHSDANERRRNRIRDKINTVLKSVAESERMHERESISLYSFRHSFATRAKMRLKINEAASLIGHTSKRMTFAYGKRRQTRAISRKDAVENPSLWIPQPDPVHAEMIGLAWGMANENEHTPSPENSR